MDSWAHLRNRNRARIGKPADGGGLKGRIHSCHMDISKSAGSLDLRTLSQPRVPASAPGRPPIVLELPKKLELPTYRYVSALPAQVFRSTAQLMYASVASGQVV